VANDDKTTELLLRAKNLTKEAFEEVEKALRQLKEQQKDTTREGESSWGKWFATISGGVAVGNLISDAFERAGAELASIPGELLELGKRGNDVSDVRESFTKLTAAIGETADATVGELRTAFGGTVNDYELMRGANEALSKGVKLTADDMSLMAKASRVMSDQVGGDSKDKWEAMMGAIASGRDKQLRELPVDYAKIEKAVDAYAVKLGVETSALTTGQRQQALHNAVLAESKRILEENGEVQNDYNDNLAAAGAQWQNLQDRVGEAIAQSPSLNAALNFVGTSLTSAFGPDRDAQIKTLTTLIGQMAQAAVIAADFIIGVAQKIQSAFAKAGAGLQEYVLMFSERTQREVEKSLQLTQDLVNSGVNSAKPRLMELQTQLASLKAYNKTLTDEINGGLAANDSRNAALEELRKRLAALGVEMAKAEQANTGAASSEKALVRAHRDSADAVDANAKATKDYTDKIRQMGADVAVAMKNGALDTWAKRNANALQELVQRSVELGKQLPANLRAAFLEVAKLQLDMEAGKRTPEILQAQLEAVQKSLEARGKLWQAANDQIGASDQAAADLRAKLAMSEFDYQVYTIQKEQDAKAAALDKYSSNYTTALSAVQNETAARMEEVKKIHNDKIREMELATNSWGNLTTKWLNSIPGLMQAAFTGGGGFAGAMKGLMSGVGGDIGSKLFGGPDGLGQKLAEGMLGKGMSAELAGKFGKLLGDLGGPIGSMVVNFGVTLGKKLFGALFGSAGRDEVKKFVESDLAGGSFDALQKKLEALDAKGGTVGATLWKNLTQGVGRNNPEQAKAAIDAVMKALKDATSIDDAIAAAGFKTQAELQRSADTAVRVFEAMRDSGNYSASAVAEAWRRAQVALRDAGDQTAVSTQKTIDAAQSLLDIMSGPELKSFKTAFAQAQAEGFSGAEGEFLAQQLQFYNTLEEGDARLKTYFSGTTIAAFKLIQAGQGELAKGLTDKIKGISDEMQGLIEQTARIHAGELIGPVDFMTDALVGALRRTGGARTGGAGGWAPSAVYLDGRKVGKIIMKQQPDIAATYGAGT
jgi:hypothetical protein